MHDLCYTQGRPVPGVSPRDAVRDRHPEALCLRMGRRYVVVTELGGAELAVAGNPHRAWELAAAQQTEAV